MKYQELISKMTLSEKADFLDGSDYWHLQGLERLGIRSVMLTDGPHGLRKKKDKKEKGELMSSKPATCFPTAATTANSWNPDLLYKMGQALAEECLEEKVSVLLGPGINTKRSPLCGRDFEYFSEDPYLAGKLGAGFVNGVQSKGVGTSLKHFAANNQEARRMTVDSVVDERTLRELYLTNFEIVVKEAKPWTVMNAYNRLNGEYCAENKWLLTDVLKKEWGYEGIVVTDWGAENDRVKGLIAGQEVEMPTSSGRGKKHILEAVQSGALDESVVDEAVDRVLDLIFRSMDNLCDYKYDRKKHQALAREVAADSMVLLKNEDNILPLKSGVRIALIGEMAKSPRYQGAGSSLVNPTQLDNAFDELLRAGVGVTYAAGYNKKSDKPDNALIEEAVKAASSCEIAVVFAGLTEEYEAEGFDRTHLNLPTSHNELISAVAAANPNTVVVLAGGSAVLMPWLDEVKGVLHSCLGGQAGGGAVADILTGKVNPSGKLAETYPLALTDTPCYKNFPGNIKTVEYREGVYVGYRYYDTAKKDVLFPFGYGLSYTSFEYGDLKVSESKIDDTQSVTVSFTVKNTGSIAGAEIAQVYVSDNESTIFRPEKELKGFKKVYLAPGEEQTVEIVLDKRSFAYYNVKLGDWHVETGEFTIKIGASSRDIRLETVITVESTVECEIPDYSESAPCYYGAGIESVSKEEFEAVLGRPVPRATVDPTEELDITCSIESAAHTKQGKFIYNAVNTLIDKFMKDDDPNKPMMMAMAVQIPVKDFISMSMGVFSEKMAAGLLDILNGRGTMKGIGKILSGLGNALKNIGALMDSI